MAYVTSDWSVDRASGNIRYIGDDHAGSSPSYATVIELHRNLQDFADNAVSSGDDELDITDENPSSRSTDNIIRLLGDYNITDNEAEHLYDGTVIQGTGGTEVIYDGIVNFGNSDVQIQIIQNGAVITDDWWNFNGAGLNADATQGISHRFMLKVRTTGSDIDGRRITGISRRFGKTYAEFGINGTGRGNNVLALSDSDDLNNQTASSTVATWNTITNSTEGYSPIDINNNGADEFYYSEWNANTPTRSINEFYERMKYLSRAGSSETLYGLNGELFRGITHEITVDNATGTFDTFEPIAWTGGTGQMLAIDSPTAGTKLWMQLLTGVIPTNGQVITGGTSSASVAMDVTITERTISTPFIGQSTGSALIGAYGIGVETDDVTASDTLFDLSNTAVNPPNNVTFAVSGLASGEDTILVGPWDGSSTDNEGNPAVDFDQLSLSGTLSSNNVTSIVVSTPIPSDTPAIGFIRVEDNNGFYRRLGYSAWTGSTFTINTTDGQEDFGSVSASSGNNVWIAYIDTVANSSTEQFTSVYNVDRDLIVKVRDGGGSPIKEFITSASLGGNGGSVTAIRTTDT